jgi:hypothetical protein
VACICSAIAYAAAFSAYASSRTGSLLLLARFRRQWSAGLVRGERLSALQGARTGQSPSQDWRLSLPWCVAPSVTGACLMLTAALHGALTLGRGIADPLSATAATSRFPANPNWPFFIRSVAGPNLTAIGLACAILSGAAASGSAIRSNIGAPV